MIQIKVTGNLLAEYEAAMKKIEKKKVVEMINALKAATPIDTGEAREGWHVVGNVIVNDVEHINKLNEGSSKQAPTHFIEKTLLAQEGVTPRGTIVRST